MIVRLNSSAVPGLRDESVHQFISCRLTVDRPELQQIQLCSHIPRTLDSSRVVMAIIIIIIAVPHERCRSSPRTKRDR